MKTVSPFIPYTSRKTSSDTRMQCNLNHFFFSLLPLSSTSASLCLSVVCCDPPDLHGDRFDFVRDPSLSPSVPQDVCPLALVHFCVFRRAVEVCEATLVEPPSCVILQSAAALHCAILQGAERITAVVVHIWGAEWSCVLVLLLLISSKGITWTETHRSTENVSILWFEICVQGKRSNYVLPALPAYLPRCILKNWASVSRWKSSYAA